jgi:hypothetical protein
MSLSSHTSTLSWQDSPSAARHKCDWCFWSELITAQSEEQGRACLRRTTPHSRLARVQTLMTSGNTIFSIQSALDGWQLFASLTRGQPFWHSTTCSCKLHQRPRSFQQTPGVTWQAALPAARLSDIGGCPRRVSHDDACPSRGPMLWAREAARALLLPGLRTGHLHPAPLQTAPAAPCGA